MSDLYKWQPDNTHFWATQGQAIASKNLWVSVLSLLCGFGVWMLWSILSVQMLNVGFPFSLPQLFSLIAIAGFSGATLRIPASLLVRLCGGRYTLFFTTSLLMIPVTGIGLALQNIDTPLITFQLLALLSGIGGGNIVAAIVHISYIKPQKLQRFAFDLDAGSGSFAIVMVQILVPLLMSYGLFNVVGHGEPMLLLENSGTVIGNSPSGSPIWLQNAGFSWLLSLPPLLMLVWFISNNIQTKNITPTLPNAITALAVILMMFCTGLVIATGSLWLILPNASNGAGIAVPKEAVLLMVLLLTAILLRFLSTRFSINLERQYLIFNNKNIWLISLLYVMSFGSFIGFSASLPLSIQAIFGYNHIVINGIMTHTTPNSNAPSALTYAWLAPFIAVLIRPIGSWLAEKFGGSRVTQISSASMILCALLLAYLIQLAYQSTTPERYFIAFLLVFLGLFAACGIANGSIFKTINVLFPHEQIRATQGWISAVAAYGAFYIPQVWGEQIQLNQPEYAMLIFAAFYAICLLLNGVVYLRKRATFYNP